MTDTERSMITLQELLRSTSVTVDQYKEAIYFCVATDTSQVDESKKESYCDACVTALIFPAPIEWILCLAATGRAFV